MSDKDKKEFVLKALQPTVYVIHGIFDFKNKQLVYVSLDEEDVELKYDVEGYDPGQYDFIAVKIMLT